MTHAGGDFEVITIVSLVQLVSEVLKVLHLVV